MNQKGAGNWVISVPIPAFTGAENLSTKKANLFFFLILLAYVIYAGKFIERTSFIIEGERYFVLFDDAMISMRYAKNLAAGHGPVWNPGERVEGFTNPLWVAWMAVFHLLPIPAAKMSLPIQISGVVFLSLNLFFVKKLGDQITKNEWLSNGAVFLTAFFFSLNNWSIQGMEVSVLTLIVTISVYWALRALRLAEFNWKLYAMLGISTLVRIDMAVPFIVITVYLIYFDQPNRRKHLLYSSLFLGGFLMFQFMSRYLYYGEWFPNTYYLKLGGVSLLSRIRGGLGALRQFIWTTGWILFAIPFLIFLLKPRKPILLLFGVVLGQAIYSIYVGGDAWEHRGGANRFLSIGMPLFFILFVYALELLRQAIVRNVPKYPKVANLLTQIGLVFFILFSLFSYNTILANDAVGRWTLQKRPIFVAGTEHITRIGLAVNEITLPDAYVAVVSAGGIPYFSERNGIDLYGKMDDVIARSDPKRAAGLSEYADLRPGHAKWDYEHSIGKLQPDIIAQLVDETSEEVQKHLANYMRIEYKGFSFYVRKNSPNIFWDIVESEE